MCMCQRIAADETLCRVFNELCAVMEERNEHQWTENRNSRVYCITHKDNQ